MPTSSGPAGEWNETRAKAEIARLVEDFERSKSDGRFSDFSEEETKKDFILPLFKALGWRVDSSEVSAEERILRGRADYGFKIGGVTKFYVEAKPLSTDVWDRTYLQQVIDYSYAKGVPWAVLTNFSRTVVLYAETKDPNPFNAHFLDLSAANYLTEFDRLRLLSRSAVASNELDSKAEAFGRKPKKQPIDKQLLKDLNSFRLDLAKDIGRLNHDLFQDSDQALEETVQRILDRLIFMRVAEDRGLEDRRLNLLSKGAPTSTVKQLRELFHRYDDNFDSKLFQPHAADDIRMDGEVVQRVLRGLHETEDGAIRYDFGAIDADVLGVMYEQYLGLILRQTPKRAKLSDGAVNRKEQGIYYTPTWVVDYIVGFSIKEALKRKGTRPDTLRVLDPACGSGTFLLRAFDHVMRARNPTGGSVQSKFDPENEGRLLALRTSVLTDNLFGVDLDSRAVEIAQLNLMIRAAETRHRLPTLERNVRVGNSIIAEPEVSPRAFNWANTFARPLAEGGFDVIVGNPPWVQSKFLPADSKAYYGKTYSNASGQFDLFTLFIERSAGLLNLGGVLGFIVPDRFLANPDYSDFRRWLLTSLQVLSIVPLGEGVFEGVAMPCTIIIVQKPRKGKPSPAGPVEIRRGVNGEPRRVEQGRLASGADSVFSAVFSDEESTRIMGEIERGSVPFGSLVDNARGVEIGKSHPAISSTRSDVPFLIGADIARYQIRGRHWLKLAHPSIPTRDYKDAELYRGEKILIRKTGAGINAVLDRDSFVIQVIYIFKAKREGLDLAPLVAILNSKLMAFYYFSKFGQRDRGVFPHLTQNKLLQLPVRVNREKWGNLSQLVKLMLAESSELSKLGGLHLDREAEIKQRVADLDTRIDSAVFDLYGLSDKERESVDRATQREPASGDGPDE
jgi:type I restriction-modification system DNA methylase subunit